MNTDLGTSFSARVGRKPRPRPHACNAPFPLHRNTSSSHFLRDIIVTLLNFKPSKYLGRLVTNDVHPYQSQTSLKPLSWLRPTYTLV